MMDFDPKLLEKIQSMDQRELSDKISEISRILGVDERRIKRMVGNPEQVRRKIGELSDADIRRLSSGIDPDTLSKLKDTLE